MGLTSILANGTMLLIAPRPAPIPRAFHRTTPFPRSLASVSASQLPKPSTFSRIRFQKDGDSESDEVMEEVLDEKDIAIGGVVVGDQNSNNNASTTTSGNSLLLLLALALGVAAAFTIASIALKRPGAGSFFGVRFLAEGSQPLVLAAPPVGFTFKAFGYRIVLPELAPGAPVGSLGASKVVLVSGRWLGLPSPTSRSRDGSTGKRKSETRKEGGTKKKKTE